MPRTQGRRTSIETTRSVGAFLQGSHARRPYAAASFLIRRVSLLSAPYPTRTLCTNPFAPDMINPVAPTNTY